MSQAVDELFSGGDGPAPTPALRRIGALLAAGGLSACLGLACSAVPGSALVLAGWYLAEKEHSRWESGFYGPDWSLPLRKLRAAARLTAALCLGIVFLQNLLLCGTPLYPALLGWAIGAQSADPP
jgi:hypothetical protein